MMLDWIDTQFAQAVAMAVIHSVWQGLLIACAAGLLSRALFFRNQDRLYVLYTGALFLLCTAVIGTFAVHYFPHGGGTEQLRGTRLWSEMVPTRSGLEGSWWSLYWKEVLTVSWLVGSILCMLRFAAGSTGIIQLYRQATEAEELWRSRFDALLRKLEFTGNVRLRVTGRSTVPFIFGIFRPVIIFPAVYFIRLTPEQFESIVIHELAHVRRHDFLVNLLQVCAESMLFFNPAVWWLSHRIRMHREFCCDDYVQRRMPDSRTYLEALYRIAQYTLHPPAHAVALFHHNSELIMRVKRMLHQSHQRTSFRSLIVGCLGAVLTFSLLAFGPVTEQISRSDGDTLSDPAEISFTEPSWLDVPVTPAPRPEQHVEFNDPAANEEALAPGASESPFAMKDTVPESQRMKELKARIDVKEQEMNALGEQMDKLMEGQVEEQMAEVEAIAEKIEQLHEEHMEQWESQFEESAEMRRLEELSEELEKRMETFEEEFEASIDHSELEKIERELELQAEELERMMDTIPEDKAREMELRAREMQEELRAKREQLLGPVMERIKEHMEQMQDPELKQIQEEMEVLQKQIAESTRNLHFEESEEMKKLQEQLNTLQESIHEKITPMQEEFRVQMEQKAREMEMLSRELQEEAERMAKEHEKKQ